MRRAWRFERQLKRFRALMFAFSMTMFFVAAQAQQPSTSINPRATPSPSPTPLSQDSKGPRRVHTIRNTDEGRDINITWNGAWVSAGRIDDKGFTVEIEIPLTTLRFKEGIESWGFNISRVIRRKNEENLWTSWQRSFGLERVSQAGDLDGVEEIRRRRLREIKPYASGEWREGVPLVGKNGLDAGVRGNSGREG